MNSHEHCRVSVVRLHDKLINSLTQVYFHNVTGSILVGEGGGGGRTQDLDTKPLILAVIICNQTVCCKILENIGVL